MWRTRVVHTTGYVYQSPVTASYNEARLTPRSSSRQNLVLNRVETIPATRSYRYIDYWGTAVTAFDLHAPHTELTVTSSSVVETERPEPLAAKATWADLQSTAVIDRFDEVLRPTPHTPASARVDAVGRRIRKCHEPSEAVVAAARWARSEAGLHSGHHQCALVRARCAGTRQGRLPGLRALVADGVAQHGNSLSVRVWVSTPKRDAVVGKTVDGRSHAWVQAWTGGWWHYDPTNDNEITEQYISVGVGRDYTDVSPLKGSTLGRASPTSTWWWRSPGWLSADSRRSFSPPIGATVAWAAERLPARAVVAAATAAVAVPDPAGSAGSPTSPTVSRRCCQLGASIALSRLCWALASALAYDVLSAVRFSTSWSWNAAICVLMSW